MCRVSPPSLNPAALLYYWLAVHEDKSENFDELFILKRNRGSELFQTPLAPCLLTILSVWSPVALGIFPTLITARPGAIYAFCTKSTVGHFLTSVFIKRMLFFLTQQIINTNWFNFDNFWCIFFKESLLNHATSTWWSRTYFLLLLTFITFITTVGICFSKICIKDVFWCYTLI